MRKAIFTVFAALLLLQLQAQNLVINPDAESLPRGTGWTIVSQGALTCLSRPTDGYLNWTIIPDGSANYPYDHTTGASGGTIFYSGCDDFFAGPFELNQTIDLSADAVSIDAGSQVYTFSGFMQTPVSPQTDRGRFVVDFLSSSNTVLGTSYTSSWQSNFDGSGAAWTNYTNNRTAPSGTRKVVIRLQTQTFLNRPAINVYFDDISFVKPSVLPITLLSFSGKEIAGKNQLDWVIAREMAGEIFELERSTDGLHFSSIATMQANKTTYHFADENNSYTADKYFYRLKMITANRSIHYSNIVLIKTANHPSITIAPNPANNSITLNGLSQPGKLSIINASGKTVLTTNTSNSAITLAVAGLPAGVYVVRFSYRENTLNQKLLIQH